MSKAGQALRQVLEEYGISQNRLAVTMDINRSTIHHWVKETRDPSGDAVLKIREGLVAIDAEAAEAFIQLYLGNLTEEASRDGESE
ncbi:MAG: helix-turn-helix transcriptional regulator [Cyanobacteriota bacterium]|nr:helix-turn-helix transcriptional regulator [Cyanobacteriota bacterium]